MAGIIIQSNNFNGQSVEITFSPFSGGSINLGTQTIPYTYTTTNYEGDYSIYIPSSDKTCSLQVGTPPSPTPTSTNTPTPTITPTNTPTPTPTSSGLDPDAEAYLMDIVTSGGTIDSNIESAVNTLFTDLKSNGLYSKVISMYPFVGATSGSHAINALLNKTYDITWYGGITHDISGSTGNGIDGYGDTNVPVSAFTNHLESTFGLYINKTTTKTASARHGIAAGSWAVGFSEIDWYRHGNVNQVYTPTGTTGMFISVRTGNTEQHLFKDNNSYLIVSNDWTLSSNLDGKFWYFNTSINATPRWSASRLCFGIFVNGLTYSEAPTLSQIINTFQTSLGRNTY